MRIVMAQLDYTIGAFSANFAKMRRAVASARQHSADLVVFSELATVGYAPGDLLERGDFIDRNLEQLDRVADLTDEGLGILVGYVDRNRSGEGKALYNAAALCHRGSVADRYIKCLLPTYDVFDEARYFEPGGEARPMDYQGVRLGVTVCEDVWADPDLWDRRLYRRDPVRELVDRRAQVLINLSASPFALGKARRRRELIRTYASEAGRCFFYVNQVGGNDELVFDGHSLVVDGNGRVVVRAADFAEDLLGYDLDVSALDDGDDGAGELGELREVAACEEDEALRALELGVSDYLAKSGFSKVVIGLSGGIDSALTAAVAARALGADNVLGVAMPSRYSSAGSVTDARALAENLGIHFQLVDIDPIFQAFLGGLAPVFDGLAEDVTEENLQARVRGAVLMALSNKLGGIVLATGNKSELAVGYCTLYGDMCGGLAVISDVSKTLVYRISRFLNRDGEVIPESTLTKPPSAELRPDQTDQDSLPPYSVLDSILEAYVERNRSAEQIVAEGRERAAVEQVVALIDRNEYKRRQAAPAIRITTKAFGTGRRYPIVADYPGLHHK